MAHCDQRWARTRGAPDHSCPVGRLPGVPCRLHVVAAPPRDLGQRRQSVDSMTSGAAWRASVTARSREAPASSGVRSATPAARPTRASASVAGSRADLAHSAARVCGCRRAGSPVNWSSDPSAMSIDALQRWSSARSAEAPGGGERRLRLRHLAAQGVDLADAGQRIRLDRRHVDLAGRPYRRRSSARAAGYSPRLMRRRPRLFRMTASLGRAPSSRWMAMAAVVGRQPAAGVRHRVDRAQVARHHSDAVAVLDPFVGPQRVLERSRCRQLPEVAEVRPSGIRPPRPAPARARPYGTADPLAAGGRWRPGGCRSGGTRCPDSGARTPAARGVSCRPRRAARPGPPAASSVSCG